MRLRLGALAAALLLAACTGRAPPGGGEAGFIAVLDTRGDRPGGRVHIIDVKVYHPDGPEAGGAGRLIVPAADLAWFICRSVPDHYPPVTEGSV